MRFCLDKCRPMAAGACQLHPLGILHNQLLRLTTLPFHMPKLYTVR